MANINQRLNGLTPLSYLGDNAVQPPDFITKTRPPNSTDSKNQYIGNIWLDMAGYPLTLPTASNIWMLVALVGGQATWVNFSAGTIISLTGNTGGPVFPTAGNINVVGDGITITIAGNPGTSTLTASTIGTGVVNSLTGNSGGAVFPTAGNINVLGTGVITVVGNPGTSTLTITPSGAIASSFPTDFTSPATPALGVLNVFGGTSVDAEQVALVYRKNMHTAAVTNTVFVKLNESLSFPATNAAGTAGVIYRGGVAAANRFIHNFGTNNTFVGNGAGNLTLTTGSAQLNTGFGVNTLAALTTGTDNTAVGVNAGVLITSGSNNALLGLQAGASLTSGSSNAIVGENAGAAFTTGVSNVLIGFEAGQAYTGAESGNVILGASQQGTVGESFVMRLGNTLGGIATTKTFVYGVAGVTTVVADAVPVLISASTSQLGVTSSSIRYKENIRDMADESSCLSKLRPVIFNYKNHSPEHTAYGLIAEEVIEIAPRLVVKDEEGLPMTVKYHEMIPMLLNEIIKLNKEVEKLKAKL